MPRYVDLGHPIETGMITYPGLPPPVVGDFLTREASRAHYAPGTEFHIGRIDMVGNTGTYVDVPFHCFEEGADLASFELDRLVALPCVVVRAPASGAIDELPGAIARYGGAAVMFATGWDRHWGDAAYGDSDHPYLTEDVARRLIVAGAGLVGIDSVNIDTTSGTARPVHTALLRAGVPIVEHLTNLAELPDEGARFTAVPPPIRGMGSFPVRAFAELP